MQVSDIWLSESYDMEEDFDHRTMYCEADITDMTGWNAQIIAAEIKDKKFPAPLNKNTRSPIWSQVEVDIHYASMIAQCPTDEEAEKIVRYRDLYDEAYREALSIEKLSPTLSADAFRRHAHALADQAVDKIKKSRASKEEVEEAWQQHYEEALSESKQEHDAFLEMSAHWKARQAIRWLE
ncbi:hypothetical protein JDN40_18145 [Rhodomicrobium vannielii ATCC 17100]|uniref:hypothetical protein n=1 Tax=Rhodomicrobium vannielii TaxID=1069 RepID=UPI001917F64B|nr:hypothetical protein [Rhodomicrobium vannielii]MBJ7536034.1 hypothetical protein [Rhodomicrobium vannielii ATCC 17100]